MLILSNKAQQLPYNCQNYTFCRVMSVVKGILKEELDRQERLQAKYSAMLEAPPKGLCGKRKSDRRFTSIWFQEKATG